MEIIRKDVGCQCRFAGLDVGDCYVLPNGATVYIKINSYNAVNLANGGEWGVPSDKVVVPVGTTLIVTNCDC